MKFVGWRSLYIALACSVLGYSSLKAQSNEWMDAISDLSHRNNDRFSQLIGTRYIPSLQDVLYLFNQATKPENTQSSLHMLEAFRTAFYGNSRAIQPENLMNSLTLLSPGFTNQALSSLPQPGFFPLSTRPHTSASLDEEVWHPSIQSIFTPDFTHNLLEHLVLYSNNGAAVHWLIQHWCSDGYNDAPTDQPRLILADFIVSTLNRITRPTPNSSNLIDIAMPPPGLLQGLTTAASNQALATLVDLALQRRIPLNSGHIENIFDAIIYRNNRELFDHFYAAYSDSITPTIFQNVAASAVAYNRQALLELMLNNHYSHHATLDLLVNVSYSALENRSGYPGEAEDEQFSRRNTALRVFSRLAKALRNISHSAQETATAEALKHLQKRFLEHLNELNEEQWHDLMRFFIDPFSQENPDNQINGALQDFFSNIIDQRDNQINQEDPILLRFADTFFVNIPYDNSRLSREDTQNCFDRLFVHAMCTVNERESAELWENNRGHSPSQRALDQAFDILQRLVHANNVRESERISARNILKMLSENKRP